jgi:hypothetical protein
VMPSLPRVEWIPTQRVLSLVRDHEIEVAVLYSHVVEGLLYSLIIERGLCRLEM